MMNDEDLRTKHLDKLSELLRKKGEELDKLIDTNYELWQSLQQDGDIDFRDIAQKSETITQNLIKIEKSIDDVMYLNRGFKEHLHTEKIVSAAHEIANRAGKLFESFEKVIDLISMKEQDVLDNLAHIEASTVPVQSYITHS